LWPMRLAMSARRPRSSHYRDLCMWAVDTRFEVLAGQWCAWRKKDDFTFGARHLASRHVAVRERRSHSRNPLSQSFAEPATLEARPVRPSIVQNLAIGLVLVLVGTVGLALDCYAPQASAARHLVGSSSPRVAAGLPMSADDNDLNPAQIAPAHPPQTINRRRTPGLPHVQPRFA
jgi:hypothetical protein